MTSLRIPAFKSVNGTFGFKIAAFLLLMFAVLSFKLKGGDSGPFVELQAVEIVHAEGDSFSESADGDETDSIREKERILAEFTESLKEREGALEKREKSLDIKLENLASVKREIDERLERLNVLRAEIARLIDEQKSVNDANITKLAKVYESTPPEQAGPLLSRLDVDIAARILLKMNNMKAGKIWGFVDPKRAVSISKELAKYRAAVPGAIN